MDNGKGNAVDPSTETFFSGKDFVDAWSLSTKWQDRPFPVSVRSSGPVRTMYAIQRSLPYGSRTIPIIRTDFYMSPGWCGDLQVSTVAEIVNALTGIRTRNFVWHVRFDHEPLTAALVALGLSHARVETRVASLADGYEAALSRYSATTRNHVRKSQRRGVVVRATTAAADVIAYYELYQQRAASKQWGSPYQVELTLALLACKSTRFLVAEHDGRIVGGALVALDGSTVYLFHSAFDRDSTHLYPVAAVYDAAIQWGAQIGATYFNLGTSGENAALERSKEAWGGHTKFNWRFEWQSVLWMRASRLNDSLRRFLRAG